MTPIKGLNSVSGVCTNRLVCLGELCSRHDVGEVWVNFPNPFYGTDNGIVVFTLKHGGSYAERVKNTLKEIFKQDCDSVIDAVYDRYAINPILSKDGYTKVYDSKIGLIKLGG